MRLPVLLTAFAALLFLRTPAGHADDTRYVVLAATPADAGIAAGSQVAGGDTISVGEGGKVTLISSGGTVVHIEGPFQGRVVDAAQASGDGAKLSSGGLDRFAAFVTRSRKIQTAGASRAAAPSEPESTPDPLGSANTPSADNPSSTGHFSPDPWLFNVDSSGPRCVRAGEVRLWRRDASEEGRLSVRSNSAKIGGATWPADAHEFVIPEGTFSENSPVAMTLSGASRRFEVHVAPASIGGAPPGALLSWFLEQGCERQGHQLIEQLHQGAPSTGSNG